MSKVEINRMGHLLDGQELKAYTIGKITYVHVDAVLYAIGVTDIAGAMEYMKSNLYFWTSIKNIEIKDESLTLIDVVASLGFVFAVPPKLYSKDNFSIRVQDVHNIIWAYITKKMEFFQWKLDALGGYIDKYTAEVENTIGNSEKLIESQEDVINYFKSL